jgi:hypothetical protein
LGGDEPPLRAQLQRGLDAGEPRQPLGPAGARNDPERHFRLTDPRVLHGDAVVACHRDLEAAAERVAVNRGDERFADVLDGPEAGVHRRRALERLRARLQRLEDVDVRAGDEGRSRADQDDGVRRLVLAGAGDRFGDRFRHAGTERVDRRIVHGEDGDVLDDVVVNRTWHAPLPLVRRTTLSLHLRNAETARRGSNTSL